MFSKCEHRSRMSTDLHQFELLKRFKINHLIKVWWIILRLLRQLLAYIGNLFGNWKPFQLGITFNLFHFLFYGSFTFRSSSFVLALSFVFFRSSSLVLFLSFLFFRFLVSFCFVRLHLSFCFSCFYTFVLLLLFFFAVKRMLR